MKNNFLLNAELIDIVSVLPKEEIADLFIAILNYANGRDYDLKPTLQAVFIPIKKEIDKNEKRYKEICDKRKEAINKRWEKEKQPKITEEIQMNTNEYKCIQEDTDNNHISYITNHISEDINKDNRVIGEEEKEEEKQPKDKYDKEIYDGIIDYLNFKAGTKYRSTSENNKKHIRARLNDGFIPEDFKVVIDNMTAKWLTDEKMSRYLRPETLFGNKFESYLNEIPRKTIPKKLSEISMEEIDRAIEEERRGKR